jgi:hypothetical protein
VAWQHSGCEDHDPACQDVTYSIPLCGVIQAGVVFVAAAGLWRGSTVAVKTMILPAKMSGAEKRERMAIMEAAISSTMAHPNIVQVGLKISICRIKYCLWDVSQVVQVLVAQQQHHGSPQHRAGGFENKYLQN